MSKVLYSLAWLSFCAVFVMCDVVSLRSAIAQESVNFWEAHQTEIRAIGLSPKGKVIISGSSTGEMTAWDVKSKNLSANSQVMVIQLVHLFF